jgi:Tol biopolymer transport system component
MTLAAILAGMRWLSQRVGGGAKSDGTAQLESKPVVSVVLEKADVHRALEGEVTLLHTTTLENQATPSAQLAQPVQESQTPQTAQPVAKQKPHWRGRKTLLFVGGGCLGIIVMGSVVSLVLCSVVSLVLYGSGVVSGTPQKVDAYAAFSPDGSQIAFTSDADIFVMNADGSNLRQLTTDPVTSLSLIGNNYWDSDPAWSPDGQQIAFMTARNNTMWSYVDCDIYIMNADGSNPHLWFASNYAGIDYEPAWSPDGNWIAFGSGGKGSSRNIYVLPVGAGSGGGAVTHFDGANVAAPSWSPDAERLVFGKNDLGQELSEIYVVGVDGSGLTVLTTLNARSTDPAWSPDGRKILFQSNVSGLNNIYVMNPDGTGLTQLTKDAGDNYSPNWSPDGRRIIFSSTRLGDDQVFLFVMDADGSNVVQLTK